jgi:hypothetical protein
MRHGKIFIAVLVSMTLLGPGCSLLDSGTTVARRPMAVPTATPVMPTAPYATEKLPSGWERRTVSYGAGRDVTWLVAPLAQGDWAWAMENNPKEPKSVQAWRQGLKANLVINGAYFDVDFTPAGYYQTDKTSSTHAWPDKKGQIDPKSYSGMVRIKDGKLQLTHLVSQPQPRPADHESILLSYPTLMSDGQALIKDDSQKYARRTVLAQDSAGTAYVIVTEQGAVSLYEASRWLAAQPERFRIAINLDGGPSTGLSYGKDDENAEVDSVPVPNVITATVKK